ncbi:GNAT family N-acetyltransferase [Nostoc sp. FACHB-87]|uniref:GNAT family N-acetyltransferase n=1 Tax=Nostocaceae TaxID=1162 RepID=UPI001688C11E|nr:MULTISPECIES: GNAT family N-acetyltransferase [Nostocaceae]MBD2456657.1 GNAT family N-acetyltransferase [Nostoc sp. FACHB-87]MBD2478089.1 GNAT family N-acetyltransferase [Anabaena sp. FACHB-83]
MVKISKRKVTKSEAELLVRQIKLTPNIIGYSLTEWMAAENIIVAEDEEGKMLGVCLNYDIDKDWYKIAALFVFEEFRGKGIGKLLFYESYKDAVSRHKHLYTISANEIVIKMMRDLNFLLFDNLLMMPKMGSQHKWILCWHSLIWIMNFYRIKEIIRKSIVYPHHTNFVYGIHIAQCK